MHPRAIETRYKGYRFRSRLDARWAVFFDALGLKWEYEPEGFELGGGLRYLPDFKINGTWFEVKSSVDSDLTKPKMFADRFDKVVCILDGAPDLRAYVVWQGYSQADDTTTHRLLEDNLIFVPAGCKYHPFYWSTGERDSRRYPLDSFGEEAVDVLRAVAAARGARFEHGENGGAR